MQWLADFWNGLSETQRTIFIVAVIAIAFFVIISFVFFGADFGGFGDWLQSWFK